MTSFDAGRRLLLAGTAAIVLGGCVRLNRRAALRTIVLRVPQVSRHVFWEKVQMYATQNHLVSDLFPQRPQTVRNFTFLLRGRGLDVVGRNNAYDPLQPNDYAVAFYAAPLFGAAPPMVDHFADAFRDTMLRENSVQLISDSGTVAAK